MQITSSPKIKNHIFYTALVIVFFVLGMTLWSLLAPLESAAVAPGSLTTAGSRRVIQHLEGGIVKAILVKDGSTVKKSDVLLKLEETQAKAFSKINEDALLNLLGVEARVNAELNHAKSIPFPDFLKNANTPLAEKVMRLQKRLFVANQNTFNSTVDVYKQRIEQLVYEINGSEAQVKANIEQLEYINRELTDVEVLAAKKLIKQSRLLALKREAAGLTGKQGELKAKIAELKQKIGETKLQIISLTEKQQKDLLDELHETENKLNEIMERHKTSLDVLKRTDIRSPIDGTVVNLKFHTVGGVIRAGEPIMDIVPLREMLVVEAHVNPMDIDVVKKGLLAKVAFSSLSARNTPKLVGKVTYVSADSLVDQHTNKPYYLVKVEIPGRELKKLGEQILTSGMPAEVFIITEKATVWEYFTNPIVKSFNRSFNEQ